MKIALFTDLFKDYSIEESIPLIAKAGYHYIELNAVPYWNPHLDIYEVNYNRLENLKNIMYTHDISLAAVASFSDLALLNDRERENNVKHCLNAINICKEFNCNLVTTMFSGNNMISLEKQKNAFKKSISIISNYGIRNNVKIAVEFDPGNFIENTKDAISFINSLNLPNVHFLFCVPHIAVIGETLDKSIDLAKSNILHFHLADTPIGVTEHKHLSPGKGDIDFDGLIKKIIDINYNDFVTIQIYSEKGEPTEIAARARIASENIIDKYTNIGTVYN